MNFKETAAANSGRNIRSEGRLAECGTHSWTGRRGPECAPAADRARSRLQCHAGKNAAHHAADSRAHQTAARSAHRSRLLLRRSVAAVRSSRTRSRKKATRPWRRKFWRRRRTVLANVEFKHDPLDQALRAAAQELGVKAGQMFQPIRVAVCGRKNAPAIVRNAGSAGEGDYAGPDRASDQEAGLKSEQRRNGRAVAKPILAWHARSRSPPWSSRLETAALRDSRAGQSFLATRPARTLIYSRALYASPCKNPRQIVLRSFNERGLLMKAVQVSKPGGNFEIVERPKPEPGRGQVRIKVEACGICHSDVLVKEGLLAGHPVSARSRPRNRRAHRCDWRRRDAVEARAARRRGLAWRALLRMRSLPPRRLHQLPVRKDHRPSLRRRLCRNT